MAVLRSRRLNFITEKPEKITVRCLVTVLRYDDQIVRIPTPRRCRRSL